MQRQEVLIKALLEAGDVILKYDPGHIETKEKANAGDLVTAADMASEKTIIENIKTAFHDDLLISEETPSSHVMLNNNDLPRITGWIIDPIDGTNNFKHGMAYSGISIGYVEAGVPKLGGIYDPYRKLIYFAEAGKGATCNGKPIGVSELSVFNAGTRVCTSNSSVEGGTQVSLDRYSKLGDVWVDVLGSSVLIMADIAAGRLDLYHHNGLKPWDNAAGFLIAREAGAKLVDLQGKPVNWLSNKIVMGNSRLVDQFIELTNS
jgi:myo-inositol-1(or 4)-monophosphatase